MAEGRLALGDLVLVVGEDVVHAARVEIDARAQVPGRHGGALDVPAGKSVAPGAGPDELPSRLRRLPQREVPRVALQRVRLRAHARLQPARRLAGQLPVLREPV